MNKLISSVCIIALLSQQEEARKVLKRIRGHDDIEEEFKEIKDAEANKQTGGGLFTLMRDSVGRRSSMVRQLEFKSEDPGFEPLSVQGEGQFFCPLRVNSCADLCVPDPP